MSLGAWGDESWEPYDAVTVTEALFRMPPPVTRGLVVNRPASGMSIHGRLFQARMWREYATAIRYDRLTSIGRVGRHWCLEIGRMTYADCVRRARDNLYLARRLNRHAITKENAT